MELDTADTFVPFTVTVAPASTSPDCLFRTRPVTGVFWAKEGKVKTSNITAKAHLRSFGFIRQALGFFLDVDKQSKRNVNPR